ALPAPGHALEVDIAGADLLDRLPQPVHDPVRPKVFGLEAAEYPPVDLLEIFLEGLARLRSGDVSAPGGRARRAWPAAERALHIGEHIRVEPVEKLPSRLVPAMEKHVPLSADAAALSPKQRPEGEGRTIGTDQHDLPGHAQGDVLVGAS